MNNFTLDEMMAAEYRRERMEFARLHNMAVRPRRNLALLGNRAILRFGAMLENMGARIQKRYECMPVSDKRELLANSVK